MEGVIGVALDGTPRLIAETALRLSEQSYRSLIEEAPYAMCRATASGQLLQVNRAMLEMLGYDPASDADLLVRDLPYIYASPERFQAMLAGLGTSVVPGHESTWIRLDGKPIQVRISVRAARDSAGRILHLDLIAENVTERKELEARFAQAQKMQAIGQLAGGIAHDFNNILTVINGYCDLLLAGPRPEGRERESLELIRQAGERATNLTQQLLAFSRKQVTHQRPVQLNQVVREVLKLSGRLIGEEHRPDRNSGRGRRAGTGRRGADSPDAHESGDQCPRCHDRRRALHRYHQRRAAWKATWPNAWMCPPESMPC